MACPRPWTVQIGGLQDLNWPENVICCEGQCSEPMSGADSWCFNRFLKVRLHEGSACESPLHCVSMAKD